MSEKFPGPDEPDDLDEWYRRAAALDPSRPSESVRRAIADHAAQLAVEHAGKYARSRINSRQWLTSRSWWRPTIFGTVAAAALAGLLVAPHLFAPDTLKLAADTSAPEDASVSRDAPALAAAQTAQPAQPAETAPAIAPPSEPTRQDQPEVPSVPSVSSVPSPAKPSPDARNLSRPEVAADAHQSTGNSPADDASESAAESDVGRNARSAARSDAKLAQEREAGTAAKRNDMHSASAAQNAAAASPAAPPAAPLAARSADNAAPLRRAAEIGDMPALRTALDGPIDVDVRDESGRTALIIATQHHQADAVVLLLAHGADPNVTDSDGRTPLQIATADHQTTIAQALKRAGAR